MLSSVSDKNMYTIAILAEHKVSYFGFARRLNRYGLQAQESDAIGHDMESVLQQFNFNTMVFVGRLLDPENEPYRQANQVYELVDAHRFDGVMVFAGGLGQRVDQIYMDQFCRQFVDKPLVTVEQSFPGIPSVMLDDYAGARLAIEHLVVEHGYRRIVFLRGPAAHVGAELRYQAYLDVLKENDIPFDPTLVSPPPSEWWPPPSFDDFLLSNGLNFEAVMGASDSLALYMMRALKRRGIRVPSDVAVVGFDDSEESWGALPPMTTVRPGHREKNRLAAELLMRQIRGEVLEGVVLKPEPELVVRRTCGCFPTEYELAAYTPPVIARGEEVLTLEQFWDHYREPILEATAPAFALWSEAQHEESLWALSEALVQALVQEDERPFLLMLEDIFYAYYRDASNVSMWHIVLTLLGDYCATCLPQEEKPQLQALLYKAHALIADVSEWSWRRTNYLLIRNMLDLKTIMNNIRIHVHLEPLLAAIVEGMEALKIRYFYLCLYEMTMAGQQAHLVLAYREGARVGVGPKVLYAPTTLLPEEMWPDEAGYSLVTLPLFFNDEDLGYCLIEDLFQVDTEGLAMQLSSVLYGVLLLMRGD
ncbi:MAG TPA: substrate-binding domain-containing protein [Anaerolineae bacterium]|nr:substrate-binding domain-containing protein [Anaerolineae bacterium]